MNSPFDYLSLGAAVDRALILGGRLITNVITARLHIARIFEFN